MNEAQIYDDAWRRHSGLTQRIHLIQIDDFCTDVKFHVLGTTNRVYNVQFNTVVFKCSCPDYVFRKMNCKHIYFIMERVIKNINFDSISDLYAKLLLCLPHLDQNFVAGEDLQEEYHKVIDQGYQRSDKKVKLVHRNNDCCICLEDINGDLFTCKVCLNAVHVSCWDIWKRHKQANCVYCRQKVFKETNNNTKSTDLLGNIQL
jgi:hypothetical protein